MIGLGLGAGLTRRMPRTREPLAALRAAPYRVAVYGDSFGQRATDILGSPGSRLSSAVSPVQFNWPTPDTSAVGSVGWGTASWVTLLSAGRYLAPYQLNRAVGGSVTGQMVADGGAYNDRLSAMKAVIAEEGRAGRAVDAVLVHAGTNDASTTYSASDSYNNLRTICAAFVAMGCAVVLHTVLPKGHAGAPEARTEAGRAAWRDELNARLVATFAAEPAMRGRVAVVDMRAAFADRAAGALPDDIEPRYAYDGLHLSPDGCRLLAGGVIAALNRLLPEPVASPLPAGAGLDLNALGPGGLMAGGDGFVSMVGNSTANAGLSLNGRNTTGPHADPLVPAGWTVTKTSGWTGCRGTIAARKGEARVGEALELTISCDASARSDANTLALEASFALALPDWLLPGERFEAVARAEILAAAGFRGVDLELRMAEPDGTVRTLRAHRTPPNGTPRLEWSAASFEGDGALVLRTAPRIRKAGTYGPVTLALVLAFAGQAPSLSGTFRLSQVALRRVASG